MLSLNDLVSESICLCIKQKHFWTKLFLSRNQTWFVWEYLWFFFIQEMPRAASESHNHHYFYRHLNSKEVFRSKSWTLCKYILHYSDPGFGPISDIEVGHILKFLFWSFCMLGLFLITSQMLTHLSLIAPLWHILLTSWGAGKYVSPMLPEETEDQGN